MFVERQRRLIIGTRNLPTLQMDHDNMHEPQCDRAADSLKEELDGAWPAAPGEWRTQRLLLSAPTEGHEGLLMAAS